MSDWRVENHTFIGKARVNREVEAQAGKLQRNDVDWLPYAVDLRQINEIKVTGFKEDQRDYTDLSHNGAFVATVNASFNEVLPHFVAARTVFDNPPPENVNSSPPGFIDFNSGKQYFGEKCSE